MSAIKPRRVITYFKNPTNHYSHYLLQNVPLNSSSSLLTIITQISGDNMHPMGAYAVITYGVEYVFGAATLINANIYGSLDFGATYKALQSSSITAGVDTLSDYVATKNPNGANQNYAFTIQNDNYTHLKAVFSATGANANDLISVQMNGGCQ